MKVQEVLLDDNKKRYMLLNDGGIPIAPVMRYLKYLEATSKSSNTQKIYCYSLKQYFTYLEETNKEFSCIRLEDLAEFVAWLRNPYESTKVTSLKPIKAKKTEKTINLSVTAVTKHFIKRNGLACKIRN